MRSPFNSIQYQLIRPCHDILLKAKFTSNEVSHRSAYDLFSTLCYTLLASVTHLFFDIFIQVFSSQMCYFNFI